MFGKAIICGKTVYGAIVEEEYSGRTRRVLRDSSHQSHSITYWDGTQSHMSWEEVEEQGIDSLSLNGEKVECHEHFGGFLAVEPLGNPGWLICGDSPVMASVQLVSRWSKDRPTHGYIVRDRRTGGLEVAIPG